MPVCLNAREGESIKEKLKLIDDVKNICSLHLDSHLPYVNAKCTNIHSASPQTKSQMLILCDSP